MILDVENLRLQYSNGGIGLVDVSLSVAAGQVVVAFGANGAGKTSTVRSISGFLRSERAKATGHVRLFGTEVLNAEPHRTAALGLAFVPERRKVFTHLSVKDNLRACGRRPSRARRREAYQRVMNLFPELAGREHETAGRLSGGQQQMLAIGRALMTEPRLLIVDEMTLGLHFGVHARLFAAVSQIAAEGAGVLIVEESSSAALDVADYCYLLDAGTVADSGSPDRFAVSDDPHGIASLVPESRRD